MTQIRKPTAGLAQSTVPTKTDPLVEGIQRGKSTQRRIAKAWKTYLSLKTEFGPRYHNAEELVKDIELTPSDVEPFCLGLGKQQRPVLNGHNAGLFLSALINKSAGTRFYLHVKGWRDPPCELGIFNTKHLIVEGDVGMWLGWHMKGGSIMVQGNASEHTGHGLENGLIKIEGNVEAGCGDYMKNGVIYVFGEVVGFDREIGRISSGGMIHIDGNRCGFIDGRGQHARVFHKGVELEYDTRVYQTPAT